MLTSEIDQLLFDFPLRLVSKDLWPTDYYIIVLSYCCCYCFLLSLILFISVIDIYIVIVGVVIINVSGTSVICFRFAILLPFVWTGM